MELHRFVRSLVQPAVLVVLPGALSGALLGSCAAPPPPVAADWQERVHSLPAAVVDASAPLPSAAGETTGAVPRPLPRALTGPLLARSELRYTLLRTRGTKERVWDLTLRAPEMSTRPNTGWVTMTTRPESAPKRYVHRKALPYKGSLSVTEDGEVSGKGDIVLPLAFLGSSLFEACEALSPITLDEHIAAGRMGEPDDQEANATAAFIAMSFAAARNQLVQSILEEITAWPSGGLFSKPDIRFGFEPNVFEARTVSTRYGAGYSVPVVMNINGKPAFYASMTVVNPNGALRLCGGVVEIVGFPADRPKDQVRLSLSGGRMPKTGKLSAERIADLLAIEPTLSILVDVVDGSEPKDESPVEKSTSPRR